MNVKQFYQETNSSYESALALLMNDAFIERMVKKFMENNSYCSLIEAYTMGDIKQVFNYAHALKGVAGNLSLTKLFEAACDLTEATRDKESANIEKEIEKLKSAYTLIEEKYKSLVK